MRIPRFKKLALPAVIIYVLLAGVIGLYLYYTYSYVPAREEILFQKGVRTLNNIAERVNEYEGFSKKILEQKVAAQLLDSLGEIDQGKSILEYHIYSKIEVRKENWTADYPEVTVDVARKGGTPEVQIKLLDQKKLDAFLNSPLTNNSSAGEGTDTAQWLGVQNLDSFLAPHTENVFFEVVALHAIDTNEVYFSNNPKIISAGKKFNCSRIDSLATCYGVNVVQTKVNSQHYIEYKRPLKIGDQVFYISGFLDAEDYWSYIKEINYIVLIIAIFITGILISAFPTIKVFVINDWERLKSFDVILSGTGFLATLFFAALLVVTLTNYWDVSNFMKRELEKQGLDMKGKLQDEIESAAQLLEDTLIFGDASPCSEIEVNADSVQDTKTNIFRGILFHEIFEATGKGNITRMAFPYDTNLTYYDNTCALGKLFNNFIDLSERDYIQEPKKDNTMSLGTDKTGFYFETVFSYTRGKTEAILSRKMENDRYRIISFDIQSLMRTNAPYGTGFALLDRNKKVLYSSKKSNNNFKNLETDIIEDGFIEQAVIHNVNSGYGEFQHGKDEYSGVITPVDSLYSSLDGEPTFYVLTFGNKKIIEWQTGVSALMNTVYGLSLLVFMLFFLLLSIAFGLSRKEKAYFENRKIYDLIYPRQSEGIHHLYLIFLALLVILNFYCVYHYGIAILWRLALSQILLYGGIRTYLFADVDNPSNRRFGKKAVFLLIISILIFLVVFLSPDKGNIIDLRHFKPEVFTLVLLAIVGAFLVKTSRIDRWLEGKKSDQIKSKFLNRVNRRKRILKNFCTDQISVKHLYVLSIFAWVLATLALPFTLISNKTHELTEKSFQNHINKLYGADSAKASLQWDDDYENYANQPHDTAFSVDSIPYNKAFERSKTTTDAWSVILFDLAARYFQEKFDLNPIAIETSQGRLLRDGISLKNTVKWIVLFALLFFLVKAFLRKVVLNVPTVLTEQQYTFKKVQLSLYAYFKEIESESMFAMLFIVGTPRSRRTTMLEELGFDKSTFGYIDFGRNTDYLDKDYSVENIPDQLRNAKILVIRFWLPKSITTEYLSRIKNLSAYIEEPILFNKPIVIFSDLAITQLESYWFELNSETNEKSISAEIIEYLKEWLRSYREFVLPLDIARFEKPECLDPIIEESAGYSEYFAKSYYSAIYFSIWNSLSIKERFILYDLAEDGILNARDVFSLMKLNLKGLISYNREYYKLEIFNRSFSLFIKNGVSMDEILEIEKLSQKKGVWGQIRLALFLLISSLLLFLYTINPTMFNALIGAAGALASIWGAVSQLSGKINRPQLGGLLNKGS